MSFFDQSYYAINKGLMSRIGLWPEQSKCVRSVLSVTVLVIITSIVGPQIIRLHAVQGDIDAVITFVPQFMCVIVNFTTVLNSIRKTGKMHPTWIQLDGVYVRPVEDFQITILQMKVLLKKMEAHWNMFKNTSAICVLDKYAERGRFLTAIYSMYIHTSLLLYLSVPLTPIILDLVNPLNETRPRIYVYDVDYGVDPVQYFWPILAHAYIATIVAIFIFVAIDTMYLMWVEHACALFEIVGFKLKTIAATYVAGKKNLENTHDDCNYQKICDCIIIHQEALSFAVMIEKIYSSSLVVVMGVGTITMSLVGLQAIIHTKHLKDILQPATFTLGQAFHLYFNNIPGQKLIDHSLRVCNFAYDFDWYDMPLQTQKLVIPILIRSKRPCLLTAGKVYVLSMESYGSVMETAMSYFCIFYQLY